MTVLAHILDSLGDCTGMTGNLHFVEHLGDLAALLDHEGGSPGSRI
jgi:hypothetical protein